MADWLTVGVDRNTLDFIRRERSRSPSVARFDVFSTESRETMTTETLDSPESITAKYADVMRLEDLPFAQRAAPPETPEQTAERERLAEAKAVQDRFYSKRDTLMNLAKSFPLDTGSEFRTRIQAVQSRINAALTTTVCAVKYSRLRERWREAEDRLTAHRTTHELATARHFAALSTDDDAELATARTAVLETGNALEILQTELNTIGRLHDASVAAMDAETKTLRRQLWREARDQFASEIAGIVDALWPLITTPEIMAKLTALSVATQLQGLAGQHDTTSSSGRFIV